MGDRKELANAPIPPSPIRILEKDSRLEHGFWRGRVVWGRAWYTWSSGFRAGIPVLDWAWELGNGVGKEFVNGVQGLGHGIRGLEWMWRGRMVCKGGRA